MKPKRFQSYIDDINNLTYNPIITTDSTVTPTLIRLTDEAPFYKFTPLDAFQNEEEETDVETLAFTTLKSALKDALALADSGVYKRVTSKYPDLVNLLENSDGTK